MRHVRLVHTILAAAAWCALLAGTSVAQDEIAPPIIRVEPEPTRLYEPFRAENVVAEIVVQIENADGGLLRIAPSPTAVLSFSGPGGPIPYALQSPDAPASAGGALIELVLSAFDDEAVGERTLAVQLVAEGGLTPSPGEYVALLDFTVLDDDGQVAALLEEVPVTLVVPARANVIFAGTSGSYDESRSVAFIDFGELVTGERRDLFVTLRSNAEATITLTSLNDGQLVHERDADLPTIPYSVVLDGIGSALTVPLLMTRPPTPGARGQAYPFGVVIGEVGGAFAGPYRDEIVIDVTPQ